MLSRPLELLPRLLVALVALVACVAVAQASSDSLQAAEHGAQALPTESVDAGSRAEADGDDEQPGVGGGLTPAAARAAADARAGSRQHESARSGARGLRLHRARAPPLRG